MIYNVSGRRVKFSHIGKNLVCKSRLVGLGSQRELRKQLLEQGFYMPTTAETFSYLDLAFKNSEGARFVDILNIFKENQLYLWNEAIRARNPDCVEIERKFKMGHLIYTCTESKYFPEDPDFPGISESRIEDPSRAAGIFVFDDRDGTMPRDRKGLAGLFNDGNPSTRWIKSGGLNWNNLLIPKMLSHPYFIAQIGGEKMIDTAERVLKYCNENFAFIGYPDDKDVETEGLTAIFSCSDHKEGFYLNGSMNLVSNQGCSLALYPPKS